jgi:hypothetical protein
MADAQVTAAAREMSRARWGSTRAERLVIELEQHREQLTVPLRARVAALAEPTEQEED